VNVDPSITGAKQNWGSTGGGPTSLNPINYSNKAVDALLDSAAHAFDGDKAKAYARRAYQAIADDAPAVWLYDLATVASSNRRLQLAPFRADGWWVNIAEWSIPADKRIDRDRIGLRPAAP
jgi:ABC-type transport system substrate-binding protein